MRWPAPAPREDQAHGPASPPWTSAIGVSVTRGSRSTPAGQRVMGGTRSSGSSTKTSTFSTPVSTRWIGRAAHHSEVVVIAAGELILPDELVQAEHVREG